MDTEGVSVTKYTSTLGHIIIKLRTPKTEKISKQGKIKDKLPTK